MPLQGDVRYRRGKGKKKHLRFALRGKGKVVEIKNMRTGEIVFKSKKKLS